jgi:hypothetical protein
VEPQALIRLPFGRLVPGPRRRNRAFPCLVARQADSRRRQVFAQIADVVAAHVVAVVRMMHREFVAIEDDAKAGAMRRLDAGAEVMQQRLDFAPVDVAADRVVENCLQDVAVLVAHGRYSLTIGGTTVSPTPRVQGSIGLPPQSDRHASNLSPCSLRAAARRFKQGIFGLEGLDQEVVHARREAARLVLGEGVGGDGDDRHRGAIGAKRGCVWWLRCRP